MKAAWFSAFGPAREVLEIGERERPDPAPGEVLVALRTSGVNPSDVKKRAGSMPGLLDEGAVIPHSDGAGTIEAVGAGVSPGRIGERVWVYQAQHARRFGTAAQLVAIAADRAPTLPAAVGFDVGACLGIPAMTAHRCVFQDGPVAGQRLVVTGGAGRVGHYAIQLASRAGATVVATARSDEDRQACREAGAVAVVEHGEPGWSAAVLEATAGRKVDRVIDVDFGANLGEILEFVRVGGTIATYASMTATEPAIPFYRMMFMDLTVHLVIVYDMPESAKRQAIADINAHLSAATLQHRVAHRVPLDEVAAAHELIERGGFRGCVVVEIP
jgi:NADPH2:quinone reductase